MDRSEVIAIVERELEPLTHRFGLEHWEIKLSYSPEPIDSDGFLKRGECTRLVDYDSAYISLNPEGLEDEESVLKTLRHELFHIILSPFDLYLAAVERTDIVASSGEILHRVWDHASERSVINLERMWKGMTALTAETR
jgi:hypothetical protein